MEPVEPSRVIAFTVLRGVWVTINLQGQGGGAGDQVGADPQLLCRDRPYARKET
jgi:hypothetical protein